MLMNGRLIATLTLIVAIAFSDIALAQKAPIGLSADQLANCRKGFSPLFAEVEKKQWLIQHGSGRSPADTCKLVDEYSHAELKLIEYLTSEGTTQCGITASAASQIKEGYKRTQAYRDRVCLDAKQWPDGHPVTSDFGDPVLGLSFRKQ
jgi:hypothetical protein